jgi:hypothetical protein
MNERDEEGLKELLRAALPRVEGEPEPGRDLWPEVLRKMDGRSSAAWIDLALLGGLVGMAALFPAAIPVFLYYL